MKKIVITLLIAVLLTGCSARETFESISDVLDVPVMAQMQKLELTLPDEAAAAAMEDPGGGKFYFCDDYTVTVQTMEAGDLDRTLRSLTGYGKDKLDIMHTTLGGVDRIECVWTAAGESGDQVGRALILSDGQYHYAVTVMADAAVAGGLAGQWQSLLQSAQLVSTDP